MFMSDISHFYGCSQLITGICSKETVLLWFSQYRGTYPYLAIWRVWFHLLDLSFSVSNKLTSSKFALVWLHTGVQPLSVIITLTWRRSVYLPQLNSFLSKTHCLMKEILQDIHINVFLVLCHLSQELRTKCWSSYRLWVRQSWGSGSVGSDTMVWARRLWKFLPCIHLTLGCSWDLWCDLLLHSLSVISKTWVVPQKMRQCF